MAGEHPRLRRQGQDALDRAIELARTAAGEVAAGGAVIRHEQRVADEDRIADDIADAGRRMARRMHHPDIQSPDPEGVAVAEQAVELRAIGHELRPRIEQPLEVGLDVGDVRSEEHTSELQSLMRISYAVFCLKKKKKK